jgi:hypothetical protein
VLWTFAAERKNHLGLAVAEVLHVIDRPDTTWYICPSAITKEGKLISIREHRYEYLTADYVGQLARVDVPLRLRIPPGASVSLLIDNRLSMGNEATSSTWMLPRSLWNTGSAPVSEVQCDDFSVMSAVPSS